VRRTGNRQELSVRKIPLHFASEGLIWNTVIIRTLRVMSIHAQAR
jgi:hypothetical protein